ncbi:MAG: MBL fold metallo-hydrolase [Chloroflexota bacterium]|nr:MBL fold metallo-hydrolase [Chloroflexota bacterium]
MGPPRIVPGPLATPNVLLLDDPMPSLTFLGTGTSNGIPVIGCRCAVCRSSDPRDRRSRASAVVRDGDRTWLIDTATELRLQALAAGLDRVDAVLMTHAHADHTGGFDDLRRFNEIQQRHLPVYANAGTAAMLRERFAYTFVDQYPFYGGKPDLLLRVVGGPFDLDGRAVIPIPVFHGRLPILGYRFGDLAYVTDAKLIPDASMALLRDLDVLVLNALRDRPHPTHLSLDEAVAVIEELRPRVAYLTHLSHELGHAEAAARLPPGVEIAHDGLTVSSRTE